MTGQHFNEILGTIMKSTHSSKKQIADYLYVSTVTINIWSRNGLTVKRAARVMKKLRVYLFTNMGGLHDRSCHL